jgi:nucleotide-binding universal stress UspA family protein
MSSRRRIVCGTELTREDGAVATEAAALARALGASLVLVHAGAPSPSGVDAVPESIRGAARELAKRVESKLEHQTLVLRSEADRFRTGGLDVRPVQVVGHPYEALVEIADSTDDSLLVVGARPGRTLGRTVDHVARHARSPVLAVPPGALALVRGLTIAVAFDGSEAALQALGLASELAAALGGSISVIHASAPADLVTSRHHIEAEVRQRAPELVRSAEVVVVPIETTVTDAVLRSAADRGARLIAVGSHARRGLARALLGSTAEAILHAAPIATLIVR